MRHIILLSILSFFSFGTFAQPGKNQAGDGVFSGRVVDLETNAAIEYVVVRLFSVKDSTVVAGIYTDAEGKFILENLPYGNFYALFTFTDFKPERVDDIKLSSTLKVANAGTIKLKLEVQQLGEVKASANLDVLKAGIDKKIYNVGEDLSVRGGTANDVLSNVPSVELDQEGRVTLRGDGSVTILIDGRPSSLSGGNGKTLLDALPAGSIERIEVVTNPSAKYDPDGTSGIINIVLKKNKLKGFNGMINGSAGSGDLTSGNVADGGASLSYRNGFFNVYGSYSGRYMSGYRNSYSYLRQVDANDSVTSIRQDRLGTDLNSGNTFRFGADFYLKTRHVLGFSATGNVGQRNRTGEQWNSRNQGIAGQTALWKRTSDDPTQQHNYDFNLNYRYDLKEDRGNIVVDFNQSLGREDIQGYYGQTYFASDSITPLFTSTQQQLFNKEKNNITTGQVDFTYLYPKIGARLETGVKTIIRQQEVNTHSETFDPVAGNFFQDTLANFLYRYNEQIYSAYGIFGQQIGKIKYQAGIRFEKAYQIPDLVSDSIRIVNDYLNFFPSAHLRYAFTPKSEMSLSYSRRINRANSGDLNPFTNYSDPFNLRKGNPYLQPEYIDSYDLGYSNEMKKVTLTTSVFYRYTTGVITRVKEFYSNNTSAVTFANIDKSHSVGLEFIAVVKPFKWWKNTISANANYIQYVDNTPGVNWNVNGINWNVKYAGTVEFWKKTASIQLNAAYNAPRISVQGRAQRRGPVDISGEKTFKDGKWSLGFKVTDIFNRQGFYLTVDQPGIDQVVEYKWLTRKYYLTFSYKFGKLEMSGKKQAGGDGGGFDM